MLKDNHQKILELNKLGNLLGLARVYINISGYNKLKVYMMELSIILFLYYSYFFDCENRYY